MTEFIKKASIFSFLLAVTLFLWNYNADEKMYVRNIWLAYFLILTVTVITHYLLIKAGEKNPAHFIRSYIAMTGIKLFLYLLVITVYCAACPATALNFSIAFLAIYFLFSSFEVIVLLKHFKSQ